MFGGPRRKTATERAAAREHAHTKPHMLSLSAMAFVGMAPSAQQDEDRGHEDIVIGEPGPDDSALRGGRRRRGGGAARPVAADVVAAAMLPLPDGERVESADGSVALRPPRRTPPLVEVPEGADLSAPNVCQVCNTHYINLIPQCGHAVCSACFANWWDSGRSRGIQCITCREPIGNLTPIFGMEGNGRAAAVALPPPLPLPEAPADEQQQVEAVPQLPPLPDEAAAAPAAPVADAAAVEETRRRRHARHQRKEHLAKRQRTSTIVIEPAMQEEEEEGGGVVDESL